MVKLLFGDIPRKKLQKQLNRPELDRNTYEDTEYLKDILDNLAQPTDITKVRLIRTFPFPAYRLTIIRRYKNGHTVTQKDGGKTLLKPGLYVEKSYFAERFIDGFVFSPALPEEIENGNSKKNQLRDS